MARSGRNRRQIVTTNCAALFKKSWSLICSGDFPEDIQSKYGGYMMADGDPYSVFHLEYRPSTYLLLFRSKKFENCITLEVVTATTFKCLQPSGTPVVITYPNSRITCVNHAFQMADELASACSTRNQVLNEYTAIIYADAEEHVGDGIRHNNRSSSLSLSIWMMLVLVLISLLIIFRLR